jgi:hypothetical protein
VSEKPKLALAALLGSAGAEVIVGAGGGVASTVKTGRTTKLVGLPSRRSFQVPSLLVPKLGQGLTS